ncbi:hypothetical protein BKA65DRAFT_514597 [Rhexocercosporidium sp. MPI-PUGE-AT-0058]|nr:hypothetical protein BKA65DRAFT_514597 [Rhexocercosporidium sp. MPI-PUGE-AT-0058]
MLVGIVGCDVLAVIAFCLSCAIDLAGFIWCSTTLEIEIDEFLEIVLIPLDSMRAGVCGHDVNIAIFGTLESLKAERKCPVKLP